ncbi:MAG TPA: AraC family transcriptional regulator [Spirochaetaceae bacterium]|nr:AraC family transcriptional regulator [Spirochaetaceae bacterium]
MVGGVGKILNVGILLFNDVELLDFAGPFEVFTVASEMHGYQYFKVFTLSRDGGTIKTVNGLRVQTDYSLDSHPAIDVLVIPGGVGTRKLIHDDAILAWIQETHHAARITCSVCSGALLLGKLGILDNLTSTTHHQVLDLLKELAPLTTIDASKRFIDNGKVMTSAGISAGIDLALHIVNKLYGSDAEHKTIEHMEYK